MIQETVTYNDSGKPLESEEREFSFCFHPDHKIESILYYFEKNLFKDALTSPKLKCIESISDFYLEKGVRLRRTSEEDLDGKPPFLTFTFMRKTGDKMGTRIESFCKLPDMEGNRMMALLEKSFVLTVHKKRRTYLVQCEGFEDIVFTIDEVKSPMRVIMVEVECNEQNFHRLSQFIANIAHLQRNTKDAWDYFHRKIGFAGSPSSGKAQPLHSNILTPHGWCKMQNIKPGDSVVTLSGESTTVNAVFPQGKKEIYEMTLEDGRKVECCLDHLWKVYNKNWQYKKENNIRKKVYSGYRVITSSEIRRTLNTTKKSLYLPLINVAVTPAVMLPIDPYILGILLGDGSLCATKIDISSSDIEIVNRVNSKLLPQYCLSQQGSSNSYNIKSVNSLKGDKSKNKFLNYYKNALESLNLLNNKSSTKFIPPIYMNSSLPQKIELLQGLMDSDGFVCVKGSLSYATISAELAKNVQELIWSIGGIATINQYYKKCMNCADKDKKILVYHISIRYRHPEQLTTLSRKLQRIHKTKRRPEKIKIQEIQYKGFEEAQCIVLNDSENLYITDNYIVTHNSTLCRNLVNALSINFGISTEQITEYARTHISRYGIPDWYLQPLIEWGQERREHDAKDSMVMVTDSPRFLPYIYGVFNFKDTLNKPNIYLFSKLYKAALYATLSYTDLILLEPKRIQNDGVRYQSDADATIIFSYMKNFLDQHNVPYLFRDYSVDINELINEVFQLNVL